VQRSRSARLALLRALLVGLAVVGCQPELPAPVPPSDAPDVVVVVIDTLRADAAEKAETPTLDSLASSGVSVPYAWSPSTWTAPSTLSLMTGSHVREHGWDLPFPRFMSAEGKSYPSIDDRPTLAEVLSNAGYATLGLYANPLLSRKLGWQRGFDEWKQVADPGMARALRRRYRELVAESAERPIFAYLHLLGPHQPLRPSRSASKRWGVTDEVRYLTNKGIRIEHVAEKPVAYEDQYIRAYHAAIEDTDRVLSDLLLPLQKRGRPLVVIVTSDHGELLGEHQMWGHEESVWNPLTHVPLVIAGSDKVALPEVMSTAAIPDYITRVAGIPWTWPVSLDAPPVLVSQRDGEVAVSGNGHLRGIWSPGEMSPRQVYDVALDPGESHPVTDLPSRAVVSMHHAIWQAGTPARTVEAVNRGLDDETRSLLEELGYMGADADDANPSERD